MEAFGPYLTDKYATPWGKAVNLDDERSDPVREWICQAAEAWIRDFHLDGLRLDAIHALVDSNPEHVVAELARRVHAVNPAALVIAESGLNDPKVMRERGAGGWGCDAAWADDFHHALRVALTGETDGWYGEFASLGTLVKAFHRPHVHDGTWSSFRERRFGAPAEDVPPERFVVFSANHDQVGNRAFGDRLPVAARPLAALLTTLSPFTPMIFQGEEYGETAPFRFFSDHIDAEIADATREGRRREFAAFASFERAIPDPQDPGTFTASQLTRAGEPDGLRELYADALALRRELRVGRRRGVARRPPADGAPRPPPDPRQLRRGRLGARRRAGARRRRAARRRAPAARRGGGPMRELWPGDPFPLGATWDGGGTNFSIFSEHADQGRAVPVRRRRGGAGRAHGADRVQLARLPPADRPRPALRLPRARAVRPARRATASTRASCCSTRTPSRSRDRSCSTPATCCRTCRPARRTPTSSPTTRTTPTRSRSASSSTRASTGRATAGCAPRGTRP